MLNDSGPHFSSEHRPVQYEDFEGLVMLKVGKYRLGCGLELPEIEMTIEILELILAARPTEPELDQMIDILLAHKLELQR